MSDLHVDFADGRTAYAPGDPLVGTVSWRRAERPSSVELRLFWYTSGKGTQDVGVVETMPIAAPGADDRRPFTLMLPREPYSFSGKLISVSWAIELIVEPGGDVERRDFVLSPTGREVVLPRAGA